MEERAISQHWQTIEIPAKDFNRRLNEFSATSTLFSRLSLIHQVAKAFAIEAVETSNTPSAEIAIEEITDPPLYGYTIDDEPVIIQFSYSK